MTYLFLYIPIFVLVGFSFNASELPYYWGGFSFQWYQALFESVEVWDALTNSLIVASSSVLLSLTMGVLIVFYGKNSFLRRILFFFYGGLAIPEIVLAVGLLSLFSFLTVQLGLITLIAAHTMLGLGYVVPIVQARFSELDVRLTEASLDLGATPAQTLVKVILPLLFPSFIAAALLVFIISFDDFIISFFCSGASAQTLPMYIFSVVRSGATPVVNALSTLLLLTSSLLVLISLRIKTRMF
jgi:spermidine/putrescine transport system permease protein